MVWATTEAQTPPTPSRLRVWFAGGTLAVYALFVLIVTMMPTPVDQGLEPVITRLLELLRRYGVPDWFGYNKLEFGANIAMFIPIGFLLGLALPQRVWWLALLVAPAFSVAIEVTQGMMLESRVGTALDVIANSAGGWIGVLLAFALRRIVHMRDERVIARALWHTQTRKTM